MAVIIYEKATGKPTTIVHLVDAKELVAGGHFTYTDPNAKPTPIVKPEPVVEDEIVEEEIEIPVKEKPVTISKGNSRAITKK